MLKNREDNLTLDQLEGNAWYEMRQEELATEVTKLMKEE